MLRVRLVLTCLLLLALPWQGALAASMRLCLPAVAGQAAPGHGGHAEAGHHGQSHAAHVAADHDVKAGAGHDDASASPDPSHRCSVCASCANAVALTVPVAVVFPHLPDQVHPSMAPPRVDTRGLPVPDKPPRA